MDYPVIVSITFLTFLLITLVNNIRDLKKRVQDLEDREFNLKVHGANPRIELQDTKVGSVTRKDDMVEIRRISYGSIWIHHD